MRTAHSRAIRTTLRLSFLLGSLLSGATAIAAPFTFDSPSEAYAPFRLERDDMLAVLSSVKKLVGYTSNGVSIDHLQATKRGDGNVHICGWVTFPSSTVRSGSYGPPAYVAFGGVETWGVHRFQMLVSGMPKNSRYLIYGSLSTEEETVRSFCRKWQINLVPASVATGQAIPSAPIAPLDQAAPAPRNTQDQTELQIVNGVITIFKKIIENGR